MPDREKVIEGLKCCFENAKCDGCPYEMECRKILFKTKENHCPILDDILAILKEQEPALPTWSQGKAYCGRCGQRLPRNMADKEINYCGYCGQAVKWDE